MGVHNSSPRAKCVKIEPEDHISKLPDCVLTIILSLLPLREAGATSVLSKVWHQLWLSVYQKLDFDVSQFGEKLVSTPNDFVEWVSKGLTSYKRKEIHEFRVRCGLDESFENDIDEWLNYAFTRKVKRLELYLSPTSYPHNYHPCRFPTGLLKLPGTLGIPSWLLKNTGEREGSFNLFDHQNLSFLTSLSLSGLNVTPLILEHILKNFQNLENLKVDNSKVLYNCIVWCAHSLRHLEITDCAGLEYITLCNAQCLVSLTITKVSKLNIENVPNLVNVSLPGFCWDIAGIIPQISTSPAKIEVLTLEVYYTDLKEVREFSQLHELKQFNLTVLDLPIRSHARLISLIRSLPVLDKFALKLLWTGKRRKPCDFRAAMKINCDSYTPWTEGVAKKCAEKLKEALPEAVEFSIV